MESPNGSIAVALGRLEVFGTREVPATRRDILRGGAPLEQHLARSITHNHLDRAVEEPLGVDPAHDDTVGIAPWVSQTGQGARVPCSASMEESRSSGSTHHTPS
jgi:hypothetical protein